MRNPHGSRFPGCLFMKGAGCARLVPAIRNLLRRKGRPRMGKLQDKVAIVTGASRGIGKAIAELFAKEGAKVVCSARTLKEGEHPLEGSLETTVAGIKKAGGEAEAVTCDVSSEADCEELVEETHKLYGPVDVLVNNAALTYFIEVKD